MDDLGEWDKVVRSVRDMSPSDAADDEKVQRITKFLNGKDEEFLDDMVHSRFSFADISETDCCFEDKKYALVLPETEGAIGKTILGVFAHFVPQEYQDVRICAALQQKGALIDAELEMQARGPESGPVVPPQKPHGLSGFNLGPQFS